MPAVSNLGTNCNDSSDFEENRVVPSVKKS